VGQLKPPVGFSTQRRDKSRIDNVMSVKKKKANNHSVDSYEMKHFYQSDRSLENPV
jgi:hypothetical protein